MATRMRIEDQPGPSPVVPGVFVVGGILILASIVAAPVFYWGFCQINVPTGYMAVMTRKTGKDIPNDAELAPDASYKGLQKDTFANFKHLRRTRHTHNPVDDAMGNAEALLHMKEVLGLKIKL